MSANQPFGKVYRSPLLLLHGLLALPSIRWPYSLFAGLVHVCWPHSAGKHEQAQQTANRASKPVIGTSRRIGRASEQTHGRQADPTPRPRCGTPRRPASRTL